MAHRAWITRFEARDTPGWHNVSVPYFDLWGETDSAVVNQHHLQNALLKNQLTNRSRKHLER